MRKLSYIISIVSLLGPLAASAQKDPVVATIGKRKILKSQLEESYRQNLLFVSDKKVTKEKILNDLINRELGIIKAQKAKIDQNPIVRKKMNDIMYHAQISKDLEPLLKEIKVTDKDVDDYYKKHPEYRTAHILTRVPASPKPEDLEAARKHTQKVYKRVKNDPKKFAELANKYSQSSTAPNGGDMGFQPAVRLAPEYFAAIKGKANGYITAPVKTQFGFHIIKVIALKNVKSINTALYKKLVYDQKRDAILANYFANARKSSKITINKKFLK